MTRRRTVTFLFTDVEGSTKLLRQLGDRFGEIRAEHEALLQEAFTAHGGRVIDTQGDSFFVWFEGARDAVLAAVEVQRALASHPWPEGAVVRVRIGISTGEPVVKDGRYVGIAIHRAARIMSAGRGGQILLSESTRRLVDEHELEGVRLRDLGRQRLKDLAEPERVFQLDAPGLPSKFPPLRNREPGRLGSRRRQLSAGVAALVAVGGAIAAVVLLSAGSSSGLSALNPNSVGMVDPQTNRLVTEIGVGRRPVRLAAGNDAVWVANADDRTVSRIDPKDRKVTATINIPGSTELGGLASGAGAVWVGIGLGGPLVLYKISPEFERPVRSVPLGRTGYLGTPWPVAVGAGSVWAPGAGFGTLLRLNPTTMKTVTRIASDVRVSAIAVGERAVWIGAGSGNAAARVDLGTNDVTPLTVASGPRAIAVGEGAVWIAAADSDVVVRIDPVTLAPERTIQVGDLPTDIDVGEGAVWVANAGDGTISRIDPERDEVVETIELGASAEAIAVGYGFVWVSVSAGFGEHRSGQAGTMQDLG